VAEIKEKIVPLEDIYAMTAQNFGMLCRAKLEFDIFGD